MSEMSKVQGVSLHCLVSLSLLYHANESPTPLSRVYICRQSHVTTLPTHSKPIGVLVSCLTDMMTGLLAQLWHCKVRETTMADMEVARSCPYSPGEQPASCHSTCISLQFPSSR